MDRPQIYGRLTEAFATWVRASKRINFGDVGILADGIQPSATASIPWTVRAAVYRQH